MPLMIGADPEFFVMRNGHFVSAHDFDCGTKTHPMETPHGAIQVDGVALECNVKPAASKTDFVRNVHDVMSDLQRYVASTQDKHHKIVARPSIHIGLEKLNTLPPFARRLGCEPDWNAYTGKKNPLPKHTSEYRTGSGHIHLGWTKVAYPHQIMHFIKCRALARQLDYYVGLVTLMFDTDTVRRSLYGQAGAFRPKKYGIEYRVPSNKWTQSAEWTGLVYDQAVKAFTSFMAQENFDDKYHGFAHDAINSSNSKWYANQRELAKVLL